MEMAQPVARQQAPLGRPRTTRSGMPASRSGERIHLATEASSVASGPARTKASRVPASRSQDGKAHGPSTTTRRALGDVSNIDKTAAHGRIDSTVHLKAGSHMRGISNAQYDETYKHKAVAAQAPRREVKLRGGSTSSMSTSASSTVTGTTLQQPVRQAGAKRVRGSVSSTQSTIPPVSSRPVSTNSRLNAAHAGLRHAASQPHSIANNATASMAVDGIPTVRSQSNSAFDVPHHELAKPVAASRNHALGAIEAHTAPVHDEDMGTDEDDQEDDAEDFSSSEELSESEDSEANPHENGVQIDDAESVTSADGSDGLDFNPDPECLVTLPPHLDAEACRRAFHISARYEQEVIGPQMVKAAEARLQAVQSGQLPPEIAANDDELAQMGLDPEEVRDTSMVAEYSKEIFAYMGKCEKETLANPQYITYQNELHWHMRTTLVDWLLQVHTRYHLLPETLFIAINIVDRFLSVRVVSLAKLQLVGVTAMFIAAKYEEIVAPSVEEFVFMTEGGYSKDEIFKGERIVLQTLDFKVSSYCSPYSWVRRISKADDYDIQVRTLAKLLMEMTLLDHRFLRAKPSLIAAISMFLSKKMLGGQWDEGFIYYSGFCEEQLIPGANLLLEKLADPAFADSFVCKKYEHKRFLKASMYARDWASRHWPGHEDGTPVPVES